MPSAIEWTEETWNPIAGCSMVSPGCHNCYAMRQAHRMNGTVSKYAGTTHRVNGKTVWTGRVNLDKDALEIPRRWKKPRKIFVNSMSDIFHEEVPDDFIRDVFWTMQMCGRHTFQVLTKRPERMRTFLRDAPVLNNVWLGVSVENQATADVRIPLLLNTPAAIRFVSVEPLLGPICFRTFHVHNGPAGSKNKSCIHWVIVGGESGPGARPMHPEWARSIRDQCAIADIPFFFKQWGDWSTERPQYPTLENSCLFSERLKFPSDPPHIPFRFDKSQSGAFRQWILEEPELEDEVKMYRIGKKVAGRLLDGVEHNGMPIT